MSTKMNKKKLRQGHPCRGCPYVFTRGGTDCIMRSVPGDCPWYFYQALQGHHYTRQEKEEIRRVYEEYAKKGGRTKAKLEQGINMLLTVAEQKYGKEYAIYLAETMKERRDVHL